MIRSILFLSISLILTAISAHHFLKMRQPAPIYPSKNISKISKLSDYYDGIKNTRGDTEVYIFEGDRSGGTSLILGGTHPNEPAGFITAVCLIENIQVTSGKLIVVPRANNSAFTHNDPQEGNPQRFTIKTTSGDRWFRYGSRSTNPIDQWPDPEVYLHHPSGQKLSGPETRNLNRSYPGKPDGSLTEQVAYAMMELMRKENVTIAVDLHEASLEYPVINAIIAHQSAFDLAAETAMVLQMEGVNISFEPSPKNFKGLSHREWGDHLGISALLMESANAMQGRYHGKITPEMIISGQDPYNYEAAQHGLLEVEYPEEGIPLRERVGRHLISLKILFEIWSNYNPDKAIVIEHIPEYSEMQEKGVGAFLH